MRFARSVSALGVLYIIKDGLPFAGESVFVFGVCVALFCGFARFARAVVYPRGRFEEKNRAFEEIG